MKFRPWGLAACLLVGCSPTYRTADVAKAIRAGDNAYVEKALRADPRGKLDDDGQINLLEVAAEVGNRRAVEAILRHGAYPNGSWRNWWKIPLKSAVRTGDVDVVRLLLEYGADPTRCGALGGIQKDKNGETIAKLLLAAGADPNGPGEYGASCLLDAAMREDSWPAQKYLEAGANPNVVGNNGVTPLHLAAQYGRLETVKLLVKHGANKAAKDDSGKTPLDLAGDLVGLLKRYGGKHGG